MKSVFLLTVDTEEEWDWRGEFPQAPFSTRNIDRIPVFQDFCASLEIRPTYFVDHAVAEKKQHQKMLREYFDADVCDIGAHLHPWCNPPIVEPFGEHTSHAINLDIDLFRRKIRVLTELLTDMIGTHPLSFRSGRWGVNGRMLEVLAEFGYRIDSSVRPFYHDKPFSYHEAPTRPYYPSFNNLLKHDSSQKRILEVPVSSGFNRSNYAFCDKLHTKLSTPALRKFRAIGMLHRLGLMRKITVTPEGESASDICRCIDMCMKRGDRLINMYFHSSDLLPGCTDYVRSDTDEKRFYSTIKQCVEYARTTYDVDFMTMRDFHETASRQTAS